MLLQLLVSLSSGLYIILPITVNHYKKDEANNKTLLKILQSMILYVGILKNIIHGYHILYFS